MSGSAEGQPLQWRTIATHPVTVGIALWAFVPLGVVLLWLNPALRKDRRWWAAAGAWTIFLLLVGKMPLVSSQTAATVATTTADDDEEDTFDNNSLGSDSKSRDAHARAEKAFTSLLADADSLWREKNTRPDAVEKYVLLLDTYCGHGKGTPNSDIGAAHNGDLARVAVRAIDSLVEMGNLSAAKQMIISADEQRLTLVFRNPKSDALVPRARSEKDQEDMELDRELERMQQRQDGAFGGRPERNTDVSGSEAPSGFDAKCNTLAAKVRPGMTLRQVTALLGPPDVKESEDLGRLNSFKAGTTLTIAKWLSPRRDNSTIILSFEDDRLTDGGTGGYSIVSGLHSSAPPGSSKAERGELQNAVRGLGITVDE